MLGQGVWNGSSDVVEARLAEPDRSAGVEVGGHHHQAPAQAAIPG